MKELETLRHVAEPLGDTVSFTDGGRVQIRDGEGLRQRIEAVVQTAVLGKDPGRGFARWLIRSLSVEAGAIPASIDALYRARGKGQVRNDFTVPALNLRALPFHAARAAFRAAAQLRASAFIFEIARSEMGYTDQRPSEYATCVLGAAVAEGYQGPVFIQGDHFQAGASRYAKSPEAEIQALRHLIDEAVQAGFFNIDIDTSTLVDLRQPTIPEQQRINYTLSAELTQTVRDLEPEGVTISVGGEIGEVGGRNSTEPELRAFLEGYNATLSQISRETVGLSKISIQTGTSHGGVVLPDGSIAQVKVDFDTLARLSRMAREEFGLGGAVQHGASTLPEDAFVRFAEAGACEVHLATNFQNMLYDRLPEELRTEMYAYLDENHADERKPDQTDEQFYYVARKRALGPFKAALWTLPAEPLSQIEAAWEQKFHLLFDQLHINSTVREVEEYIQPARVAPKISDYVAETVSAEDVGDLAD